MTLLGWVEARMLAPGDEILDYDGNTPLTVISNVFEETTERVYNFEVEGMRNYFAGDVGAWVHNAPPTPQEAADDIFRRRNEMLADKDGLFDSPRQTGKHTFPGHKDQMRQRQRNLRNRRKKGEDCTGLGIDTAIDLAVPSKPHGR